MKFFAFKNVTSPLYFYYLAKQVFRSCCIRFPLLFIFIFFGFTTAHAQDSDVNFYEKIGSKIVSDSLAKLFITSVEIYGNKKTKDYIIKREMRFKQGDSILASEFNDKLTRSKELIYNSTLFTEVTLVPHFISATDLRIEVHVKEKWYIYPSPQFQIVDRNLNEWINRYNADLERVIYGVKFAHYNLSGRRDQLKLYALNGYARKIAFNYTAPYSNRALTEGFSVSASYTQNREITYKTSYDNIPLRYKATGFIKNAFFVNGAYLIRRGFYRKHTINLGYNNINVNDSIIQKYNPNYFNLKKNYVGYPELSYSYQYIHTDNINYPLRGKIYSVSLVKRGVGFTGGINMVSIETNYNKFFSLGKNLYGISENYIKIKAPLKQSFVNQRALGYDNLYLRGLEKYVIDGVAIFLTRHTIKKKIVAFKIPVPFKNKFTQAIPFSIFAKTFADLGYSYNTAGFDTKLGNRLLYTGGVGIDILSLYDINLKLEYSFNQLGEKGLFLHAKGGF